MDRPAVHHCLAPMCIKERLLKYCNCCAKPAKLAETRWIGARWNYRFTNRSPRNYHRLCIEQNDQTLTLRCIQN